MYCPATCFFKEEVAALHLQLIADTPPATSTMSPILSTIVLALTLVSSVHAFFRINCANIQRGRIDPLVNPGTLAAHTHSIVGGSSRYTNPVE